MSNFPPPRQLLLHREREERVLLEAVLSAAQHAIAHNCTAQQTVRLAQAVDRVVEFRTKGTQA